MKESLRHLASHASVSTGCCALGRTFGNKDGALIFYGHRVTDDDEGYLQGLRPDWLDQQLAYLTKHYEIISLRQLVECLESGQKVPQRSAVITFDDGFRDNFTHGFPILQKYQVPATIFVVTGSLSTGELPWSERLGYILQNTQEIEIHQSWMDPTPISLEDKKARYEAYCKIKKHLITLSRVDREDCLKKISSTLKLEAPKDRMLSWAEAKELQQAGIEIGAHTYSHPLLAEIEPDEAVWEMKKSKADLEEFLNISQPSFCFPVGSWNQSLVNEAIKLGFRSVFTPGSRKRLNQITHTSPFSLSRLGLPNAPRVQLEAELDGPIPFMRNLIHKVASR